MESLEKKLFFTENVKLNNKNFLKIADDIKKGLEESSTKPLVWKTPLFKMAKIVIGMVKQTEEKITKKDLSLAVDEAFILVIKDKYKYLLCNILEEYNQKNDKVNVNALAAYFLCNISKIDGDIGTLLDKEKRQLIKKLLKNNLNKNS